MIPDGEYTAVVDRIEDGLAALEVAGDEGRYELMVSDAALPAEGRHADAVLQVTLADEDLVEVAYDPAETTTRTQQAQERFERLSRRPPSEEDDG